MEGEVKSETQGETMSEDSSKIKDVSPILDNGNEDSEVKDDTEEDTSAESSSVKDNSIIPDNLNQEDEDNEVKGDTEEKETSEDPSNLKDNCLILENKLRNDTHKTSLTPDNGIEEEFVSAEVCASHDEAENSQKVPEEAPDEAATSEPAESSRGDVPGVDKSTTSKELDVNSEEDRDQQVSHEDDRDGPAGLHPESPAQETEEDESAAAEDISYEEHMQLLQELCKERDTCSQHNSQLQLKLADYLHRKARDDPRLERDTPAWEQLQEYERHVSVLSDMKQQLAADSGTIQQKTEELRLLSQENRDKAEGEWQAFVALKRQVAMAALSRCRGKQEAQAKVESALAAEQARQDELTKLRLRHLKLGMKIHRLEAELRDAEEHGRDPLQLQYEQLQAARLEQKKQAEKQSEESMKLQAKISSSLEVLTNVKEKLFWTQMEVQAKREELAEVEAIVARKRGVLTRIKQARNALQRDNQRLKERRGLLGNKTLLRDFEDTVDASDVLKQRLENLKCRQAEIVLSCARWRKRRETDQ